MADETTISVKRDDGSTIELLATPQHVDDDGVLVHNSVYQLTSDVIPDAGLLAFHLDDKYEWEYYGDVLSDNEIHQVVAPIQQAIE